MDRSEELRAGESGGRKRLPGMLTSLKIRTIVFVIAAGVFFGNLIYKPNKRVIESIVGILLVYVLWNFSTTAALWMLIVIYPFPFGISIGTSTFILIIITFIIFLIRVSTGMSKFRTDRYFNLPLGLMVISYIISFYNFEPSAWATQYAFIHTTHSFGMILLFYMIVNFIDDEEKLQKTVKFSMITIFLVLAFVLLEMRYPNKIIIPGWIYTTRKVGFVLKGIRMGGPFQDYELLAEFLSMNAPIIFFLVIRSKRLLTRSLYMGLLIADLFMLFTTITRGAFISLMIALVFMAFICRKDLNFVRLVIVSTAFIAIMWSLEAFVSRYTIAGSLFDRISTTYFERGVIPDSRVYAWTLAVERGMEHPFIGHSPGWDFTKRIDVEMYPHNAYLFYFNITGFFGLFAFLFLLYRLVKATFLGIHSSLINSPFSEAFMKILQVSLLIFVIDQYKIEFLRNETYMFYVWFFFGLIAATRNIILKNKREQAVPAPPS